MILRKGLRGTLEVSDRDRDPDTHGEKQVLDIEEQVMSLFLIIEWYFTHLDLRVNKRLRGMPLDASLAE